MRVTIDRDAISGLCKPGGLVYRQADTIGSTISTVAKLNVGVNTGRLRRSISHKLYPRRYSVRVRVRTGVRYARIHHEGRGPVHARPGHYLRFRGAGRRFVYRKSVGPAKGNPFLVNAVVTVLGQRPRGGLGAAEQ